MSDQKFGGLLMKRLGVIVGVLALAAFIIFSKFSAQRAKEAVRIADARTVQSAIRAYTTDKGSAPKTLNDLVEAGYLKALPEEFSRNSDPIPQQGNSN
jgi:general secretion pathway protein G